MVITLTTQIDGHAQPVAIEAQDGQDPDEPPIRLPSPPLEPPNHTPEKEKPPVSVLQDDQDDDTATNSVVVIDIRGSKDGSLTFPSATWDGNPDTAHVSRGDGVAAHLGVNPQYVSSSSFRDIASGDILSRDIPPRDIQVPPLENPPP